MTQIENKDTPQGLGFALAAYLLWGFLPIYMKWLDHIPSVEVVAHRIIWSVPIAGALLVILGRTRDIRAALANPRMLGMGFVTAALISVNWTIYVWAIASDQALDAALGYYINPLFSIFLGAVFLRERLKPLQIVAILLAASAVAILAYEAGRLPWISISLTLSWGFYALFKKSLPIGPNQGFMLEVLILTLPAVGYLIWLATQGQGTFATSWDNSWLLMGSGLVTAVPLILYANGAKLLRLSTIGILQYIAPTLIFLVAIFLFGETLDRARMIAFPMIWAALVVYSIPMIQQMRKK